MFTSSTSRKRTTTVTAGFAVTFVALSICGTSAFADDGEPAAPPPIVTMVLEPTPTLVLELGPVPTIVLEVEPTSTILLEVDPPPTMDVDDILVMPLPGDDDVLEVVPLFPEDTEPEDSVPGDGPLQAIPVDPIVPFVPLDVPEFPEGDDATTTTSSSTTTSPTVDTGDTGDTGDTVEPTVPVATTDPLPPTTSPANLIGRLPATGGSPSTILVVAGTLIAIGAALSIVLHRTRHNDR